MAIENRLSNLMTLREVSKLLHVHPNTLRRWSDQGKIPVLRIASRGDRRFIAQDVINFLNGDNSQKDQ